LQRKIQKLFSTWVDKPWTWQTFNCSNIEIWVDADRFNGFYWIQYSKGKLNTKTYKLCVLYFDTGVYKFIKNLSAINFLALTAILMTISDFYWQWLLNIIAHFKLTDVNWCFIGVIIQVCWKNLSFKAKRNTWKVLEDVDYLKEGSGFSVYCLHEKLTIELISRIQLSTATKEYLSEFVKHYRCCIHSPNTLEWAPLSTAARTSLRGHHNSAKYGPVHTSQCLLYFAKIFVISSVLQLRTVFFLLPTSEASFSRLGAGNLLLSISDVRGQGLFFGPLHGPLVLVCGLKILVMW